jgi:ubiquinone/menaquinone biosynthesis C-methylase UbiE
MTTAGHQRSIQDKTEIMRGYNLIMSRIYNFLTRYLLSALVTKTHYTLIAQAQLHDGELVLDVGCGTATQLLIQNKVWPSSHIVGVDLSISMLKNAKKRLLKAGQVNTELVLADAEHLPFKDEAFDAATCAGVFRFLPQPQKMLSDAYRVLKRQSSFVLREYAGAKKGGCIEIQHIPLLFEKPFTVWRLHSDQEIKNLFSNTGFVDVGVLRKGKVPHVAIAMGGFYRTNMVAYGKKP